MGNEKKTFQINFLQEAQDKILDAINNVHYSFQQKSITPSQHDYLVRQLKVIYHMMGICDKQESKKIEENSQTLLK